EIFEDDNELDFEEEEQKEIHFLEFKNFDSFFNVTDTELRQVLEIEVTVEVPCLSGSSEQIDDSDQDFDIESILNNALKRNSSNITEIIE
ncbi:2667_t:CDS:1, partial [Dentiscutata erythropus]